MKVLILNNFNSSGSMLQDMVVWKSCDGHISKDTRPFGVNITYFGSIDRYTCAKVAGTETSSFAMVERKRLRLERVYL